MPPPVLAPLDSAEVERRLPLWTALADLFLDTDVMLSVPYIARTIVEGGWQIDEAEAALRWEVRPAFYVNLLDIAGEWAGWHPDFVRERVLEKRGTGRIVIGNDRFMPKEWNAVVAEIARLRRQS
ncbi:DUF7079 family protein [Sphingomonas koreensis]